MEVIEAKDVAQYEFQQCLWSSISSRSLFHGNSEPSSHEEGTKLKLLTKVAAEYARVRDQPMLLPSAPTPSASSSASSAASSSISESKEELPPRPSTSSVTSSTLERIVATLPEITRPTSASNAVVEFRGKSSLPAGIPAGAAHMTNTALALRNKPYVPDEPEWHAPWKIYKVISGHLGWVRCVSVDPSNEWFCTGSADRMIKIWDLASGQLKLSLTGHISPVRAVLVSPRHPYLFSAGEDKQVKCWDLEYNKVIRNYHGHQSGVYCMEMHPTIDVLITGSRDSTARVWDIRTKAQVHVLGGHTNTVASISCQNAEPQVITGSHDATIRLWDLAAGKSVVTLTNHKKSVRSTLFHPKEYSFISASTDNMKIWKCPEGQFLRNVEGHNAVINCMAVNQDNVLVSGGDNGSLHFWDWSSGHNFQTIDFIKPQPGSLDSESGVFACTFDQTGSRLITCEADKSIKLWKEDETATPESHPINFRGDKKRKKY